MRQENVSTRPKPPAGRVARATAAISAQEGAPSKLRLGGFVDPSNHHKTPVIPITDIQLAERDTTVGSENPEVCPSPETGTESAEIGKLSDNQAHQNRH